MFGRAAFVVIAFVKIKADAAAIWPLSRAGRVGRQSLTVKLSELLNRHPQYVRQILTTSQANVRT